MIYPESNRAKRPEPLATKSAEYGIETTYPLTANAAGNCGFVVNMGGVSGGGVT